LTLSTRKLKKNKHVLISWTIYLEAVIPGVNLQVP